MLPFPRAGEGWGEGAPRPHATGMRTLTRSKFAMMHTKPGTPYEPQHG
jgi:hypothetical protein